MRRIKPRPVKPRGSSITRQQLIDQLRFNIKNNVLVSPEDTAWYRGLMKKHNVSVDDLGIEPC